LQYYIQKVIWSDPEQVAEAYSLLKSLKEALPLAVSSYITTAASIMQLLGSIQVSRL